MPDSKVASFFNRIAHNYDSRYTAKKPLHQWYFQDRLRLATEGLSLKGKKVLDIGAGTGALYSHLMAICDENVDYQACDISSEMLASSPIPEERRFVGTCYEIPSIGGDWDIIFILGVTTYMTPADLEDLLAWCRRRIAPNGTVVVTFSTKGSFNSIAMKPLMPLIKAVGKKDRVAAQAFDRSTYTPDDTSDVVGDHFIVRTCYFLNQTFFPLNHIFPRTSIALAETIRRRMRNPHALAKLSGEFLMHLSPH